MWKVKYPICKEPMKRRHRYDFNLISLMRLCCGALITVPRERRENTVTCRETAPYCHHTRFWHRGLHLVHQQKRQQNIIINNNNNNNNNNYNNNNDNNYNNNNNNNNNKIKYYFNLIGYFLNFSPRKTLPHSSAQRYECLFLLCFII